MQTLRQLLADIYGGTPEDHTEAGRLILRWLRGWLGRERGKEDNRWRSTLNPWELARDRFRPEFVQWIAARQSEGDGPLPPLTMAKSMLRNSQDRGTPLAQDLWDEFQAQQQQAETSRKAATPGALPWEPSGSASIPDDQAQGNRDRMREMLRQKGIER